MGTGSVTTQENRNEYEEGAVAGSDFWLKDLKVSFAKVMVNPRLPQGAVGLMRARILDERRGHTPTELYSHYVNFGREDSPSWDSHRKPENFVAPGYLWLSSVAEGTDLDLSEVEREEIDKWDGGLTREVLRGPWDVVAGAIPLDSPIFQGLLNSSYPLPWCTVRIPSQCDWSGTIVVAVLPRLWADILIDFSTNHRVMRLEKIEAKELEGLCNRPVSDVEMYLALGDRLKQGSSFNGVTPQPPLKEVLQTFISLLPLSGENHPSGALGLNQIFRVGGDAKKGERMKLSGGRLAISVDKKAKERLSEYLGGSSGLSLENPMERLLGLLEAFRADPDLPIVDENDWEVYQAFWPYFFSGYWTGIDRGLDLLVACGAEVAGIFSAENSEDIVTVYTNNGCLVRVTSTRAPEHDAIAEYLETQRSWSDAYEMPPRAPRVSAIPVVE